MKAIEIKNLTKYYGKSRGVEELSLSVDEGEFYGFIGPNGAGKSTTIRTLLGLIRATSGEAFVLGRDLSQYVTYLKEVGYLQSETTFYDTMKVSEIIRLSADIRGLDCSKTASELCERLKLDTSKKVRDLSLGNRKKVGIVCAMQHNPRLYILDEPTSGLDPLIQKEFFELLDERKRAGSTIFMSSHVLSEIQHHCDRASVIKDGRLIVEDSIANLSATGVKKVTLSGAGETPAIDGISSVTAEGDHVSFLYKGDAKDLIAKLQGVDFTDVNITSPELEEIIFHYYEN